MAEVNLNKDDKGFAATETLLMVTLFLGVFIAVMEVSMLCVRGELMSYATARAARVSSVYRNDYAHFEAGSILPTTWVNDLSGDNVAARTFSTTYEPFTLTRVNLLGAIDKLTYRARAVPTLPDGISAEELRGDNPLPYCQFNSTEINPCDPM